MRVTGQIKLVIGIIIGGLVFAVGQAALAADTVSNEIAVLIAPPPPNAAERAAAFADRNSPENLKRLADELFSMMDLGKVAPAVRERYGKGDVAGALEAYRDFFMERMILPPPGYPFGFSLDFGCQIAMPKPPATMWIPFPATADELMSNVVVFVVNDKAGKPVRLRMNRGDTPGCFNWTWSPEDYYPPAESGEHVNRFMAYNGFFDILLAEYFKTHDKKYLDKWVQLVEDRYLNYNSEQLAVGKKIFGQFSYGLEYLQYQLFPKLAYMVRKDPGFKNDFPASTLARIICRCLGTDVPISIRSGRQETGNRKLGMRPSMLWYTTRFLPEFKGADYCVREFRRMVEIWPATDMYPDGVTPGEETLSYYAVWPFVVYELWNTVQRVDQPEWTTPAWGQEMDEILRIRARNLLHEVQNNGGSFHYKAGMWANYFKPNGGGFWRFLYPPAAMADPDIERIRSTVFGNGSYGPPSFTSEAFPYGGHYLLRSGWGTNDDVQAFMLNHPEASHADLLGLDLQAYGTTILDTDWGTPMRPDGMMQLLITPLVPYYPSRYEEYIRTMTNVFLNIRPQSNRWHSSRSFALCEASHSGPFVNRAYLNPNTPQGKEEMKTPLKFTTDIRHQRQILMIQQVKAFIVTDRLFASGRHNYQLGWKFVMPNTKFAWSNNVSRTMTPDSPNLSIYYFRHATATAQQAGCSFEGTGNQAIISLLYPRRTLTDEVQKVQSLPGATEGVCGFDATFADGTRVLCQAAPAPERLQADNITAVVEQLVLTKTAGGERRGIILGCKDLKIAGKTMLSPGPDFEFTLGKRNAFRHIYYPLGLVRILPRTDCFVDELQVTLEPPAPDVDIRYTTDLSDPDVNSPLYEGPFKVQHTTTVKARAFRKGVKRVPTTFDNTLVSAVSRAQFTKLPYRAPADSGNKTPAPGLNVSYFEGDGRLSALFLNQLRPEKQGQANELFDLSLRQQASNNYAFVYSGYLDIPQDGVYSFYAPVEMYCPKIDAGYDLRVFLGDEEWYPGTRLHNLGIWSVPLKRGLHQLQVWYVDQRPSQAQWLYYPYWDMESFIVWRGEKPVLEISGPGLEKQPIPAKMLFH